MSNLFLGIITILICAVGYYLAFRLFKKNGTTAVVLLVLCGLFLRVYTATDFYLHEWDERYHALVAKNLIEHPLKPTLYDDPVLDYDYRNWTANHIWVHKQPVPLWAMAASMYCFGINEIALRLPSILLTTLGIWLMFLIGRELYNKQVGFIAAFLYSIHGLIIELTGGRVATDHVDVFFLFFIQLAMLFAIFYARSKSFYINVLCGISIGIAILCKWLPALIVLPLWLLLILDKRSFSLREIVINSVVLSVSVVAVFLPWQLYVGSAFPIESAWERAFNVKHLTEVLEDHGGSFFYHFDKVRILFGEIIYLPLLWFMWKAISGWKNYRRMALAVWFLVPFLFFSFAATKMQGYTLFTAPAIFIITALFWHYLYVHRKNLKFQWLTYVVLALLIALPIRYSIERVKPFEKRPRTLGWVEAIKDLHFPENAVLFNVPFPIEAMFYTDCAAYADVPTDETIERITGLGYQVLVNETESVGRDLLPQENVKFFKLPPVQD